MKKRPSAKGKKLPPAAKVRRPSGKADKVWVYPSRGGLWGVSVAYGKRRVTEKFKTKSAALRNAKTYKARVVMGSEFSHLPKQVQERIRTQTAILIHFDKMHPTRAFAAASSMFHYGKLPKRFPKAKVSAIQKAKKGKTKVSRDPDRVIARGHWPAKGKGPRQYLVIWYDAKERAVVYESNGGERRVWATYDLKDFNGDMRLLMKVMTTELRYQAIKPFDKRMIARRKAHRNYRAKPLSSSK